MNEKLSLLTLFIEKLEQARIAKISQNKISKDTSIAVNTISRYVNGHGQMQTDNYEKIVNYINSKLDEKAKK